MTRTSAKRGGGVYAYIRYACTCWQWFQRVVCGDTVSPHVLAAALIAALDACLKPDQTRCYEAIVLIGDAAASAAADFGWSTISWADIWPTSAAGLAVWLGARAATACPVDPTLECAVVDRVRNTPHFRSHGNCSYLLAAHPRARFLK